MESIKRRLGGLRTAREFMRSTMFVGRTGPHQQHPPSQHADQMKNSCQLPELRDNWKGNVPCELERLHFFLVSFGILSRRTLMEVLPGFCTVCKMLSTIGVYLCADCSICVIYIVRWSRTLPSARFIVFCSVHKSHRIRDGEGQRKVNFQLYTQPFLLAIAD